MDKEITKLDKCVKAMKKCLKTPNVGNCVCFADAVKVLDREVNKALVSPTDAASVEKLSSLKREIKQMKRVIRGGEKECLGCAHCFASLVFDSFPDAMDQLYLDNEL